MSDGLVQLENVIEAWTEAHARGEMPAIESFCNGDEELARAARKRLKRLSAIEDALGLGAVDPLPDHAFGVGTTLGGYELTRIIGEGGFGVVFEARRTDGLLGRFAVKVLSRSMFARDARARFTTEGRALSIVRHEHVAAVIDAGVSGEGVPYLVMDYIEGASLTTYCRDRRRPLEDRLGLFLQACAAVEHAHAKGVIHRDLKPGNMLVEHTPDGPNLKVIDFGIARILGASSDTAPRQTREGEFMGTAAYMSPEQLGVIEADTDTRSDIYSLGVVLYELVIGTLPYQKDNEHEVGTYELQRRLRETSPVSISRHHRLRNIEQHPTPGDASLRNTSPNVAFTELNWIIMQCLAAEPERRYATCRELADDVRRLLEGRPVSAGPASRLYAARKFVSRHRLGVANSILFACALSVAGGVATYGLVSAAREGRRAIRAEEDTRQVADFQAEQLASIDATTMGASIRAQVLSSLQDAPALAETRFTQGQIALEEAEAMLEGVAFADVSTRVLQENVFAPSVEAALEQFGEQPEILGRLLHSIGVAQTRIGLLPEGLETHDLSRRMLTETLSDSHLQTLSSTSEYANTLRALGRYAEAEAILRDAIRTQETAEGPDALRTLTMRNDYAMTLFGLGQVEEGAKLLQQTTDDAIRALGDSHNLTATIRGNLGDLLDHLGRPGEAEVHHRKSLEALEAEFGPRHQATIIAKNNLAKCLVVQGKFEQALPLLEETAVLAREELGRQHPTTLLALSNLAITLQRMGHVERALRVNSELLEVRREVLGEEHLHTLISMNVQAGLLLQNKQPAAALELARTTTDRATELLGQDRYETAIFRSTLARALAAAGEYAEAARHFDEIHATLAQTIGVSNMYAGNNARWALTMYESMQTDNPLRDYSDSIQLWRSRLVDQLP